jgi:hypothetical protein
MRMSMRHRVVTAADRARLAEQLAEIRMAIDVTEGACCCPARPMVRVVMPATDGRPEPVDLLLCGHHYRAGYAALRAAGAAVYDTSGALIVTGSKVTPRYALRLWLPGHAGHAIDMKAQPSPEKGR